MAHCSLLKPHLGWELDIECIYTCYFSFAYCFSLARNRFQTLYPLTVDSDFSCINSFLTLVLYQVKNKHFKLQVRATTIYKDLQFWKWCFRTLWLYLRKKIVESVKPLTKEISKQYNQQALDSSGSYSNDRNKSFRKTVV